MCHVLVIEDDWLIADHICGLVEDAGALSVAFAATEDDAVASAIAAPPAVIVSDVNLRGDGTGPSAVMRIFEAIGTRPVMFVTGEPRPFEPPQPEMKVLYKPVDDRKLVETFKIIAPV
jgi:two-component system, response regulator PdtaR